jgi:hypothetical protein
MERWEYKHLILGGVLKEAKPEAVEERLNELGQEAWEAVGISHDASGRLHVLLKHHIGGGPAHKSGETWAKW